MPNSIQFLKIQLRERKNLVVSLTKIFGIYFTYSRFICKQFGFNTYSLVKDIDFRVLNEVRRFIILTFLVQNQLSHFIHTSIQTLISIKSIRGLRHKLKLPVRGQRTRTNHKTQRKLVTSSLSF